MQARRALSLSALLLTTLCTISSLGGCGDDDQTIIYVYLEAGAPEGGKKDSGPVVIGDDDDDDGGTFSCSPQQVPALVYKAPPTGTGKCTLEQLGQLYDTCVGPDNTIAGCKQLQAEIADCATCTFGTVTDDPMKPWLVFSDAVAAFPNIGFCMANFKNETDNTQCGPAYYEFFGCLDQACVAPCFKQDVPQSQIQDAYGGCLRAAIEGKICVRGGVAAGSATCQAAYGDNSTAYGYCNSLLENGKKIDDREHMIRIANLICGAGNPQDGGTDAGDAGADADAGDAGDADAK